MITPLLILKLTFVLALAGLSLAGSRALEAAFPLLAVHCRRCARASVTATRLVGSGRASLASDCLDGCGSFKCSLHRYTPGSVAYPVAPGPIVDRQPLWGGPLVPLPAHPKGNSIHCRRPGDASCTQIHQRLGPPGDRPGAPRLGMAETA